jgi:hypothetical protein
MKTIFVVQGYEKRLEDGRLEEVVTYEIYAKTDKEALKKANSYCKKPFYRVSQVIEK